MKLKCVMSVERVVFAKEFFLLVFSQKSLISVLISFRIVLENGLLITRARSNWEVHFYQEHVGSECVKRSDDDEGWEVGETARGDSEHFGTNAASDSSNERSEVAEAHHQRINRAFHVFGANAARIGQNRHPVDIAQEAKTSTVHKSKINVRNPEPHIHPFIAEVF